MSQFKLRVADRIHGERSVRAAVTTPEVVVVGVGTANDEAVEVAREERPDVLLLQGDRAEDASELVPRVREVTPGTKVIVVSGGDEIEAVSAVLGAGADGFVHKTITEARLVREVLALLSGAEGEAATALAGEPASARRARRFVNTALDGWGRTDVDGVVGLLVTELVANAIRHASSDVEVAVHLLPDRLRVEVHDGDERHPRLMGAGPGDESGRGIALVDALARAWGVAPTADGKDVWFEISC